VRCAFWQRAHARLAFFFLLLSFLCAGDEAEAEGLSAGSDEVVRRRLGAGVTLRRELAEEEEVEWRSEDGWPA
jgi:hypothetical protein